MADFLQNFLKGKGSYLGCLAMIAYGLAVLSGCCEGDKTRAGEMVIAGITGLFFRRAIGEQP